MGFFDKAKEKITNAYNTISEETVREIDYDKLAAEKATNPKEVLREEKTEKPKPKKEPRKINFNKPTLPKIDIKKPELKPKKEKIKEKPVVNKTEETEIDKNKVKDILDVLNISETFEIPSNVLFPEDIEDITIDLQVPKGYDIGQVNTFIEQVKASVEHYIKLLKTRNNDVAKLATTVDRLEADLNHIRFEAELANGINIMPTDSDEGIDAENTELKLEVRRLKSLLEKQPIAEEMSEEKQNEFNDLQDKYALAKRQNSTYESEIQTLKSKLAYFEEYAVIPGDEDEDEDDTPHAFDTEENDDVIPSFSDTFAAGLEALPKDEDTGLPDVEDFTYDDSNNVNSFYSKGSNDVFYGVESDPLQDLINSMPAEEVNSNADHEETDEERLERLMNEEGSSTDYLSGIMSDVWNSDEEGNKQ